MKEVIDIFWREILTSVITNPVVQTREGEQLIIQKPFPSIHFTNPTMFPCSICNGESCFVVSSLASPRYLCLLHYYSTGAHRSNTHSLPGMMSTTGIATKKKNSSLLVDYQRMEKQLPNVQELFAEAFVELQKDIREESARAFQSVATAEDPLAILLGSSSSSHDATITSKPLQNFHRGSYNKQIPSKRKSDKYELEGGFIREAVLPERLRKLQNPLKYDGFASVHDSNNVSAAKSMTRNDAIATQQQPSRNPYQRKPPTNIWNQIVDSIDGIPRKERAKMKWEDVEKEMTRDITSGNSASSKKCTCGSCDVEISGKVTSRNTEMMRGEVWGMKNRSEIVVERCRCLECGKTWNDEEG